MKRLLPFVCALPLLGVSCSTVSTGDADRGTSDSYVNRDDRQGGSRMETSIWSNDPAKKTWLNQNLKPAE
jgi:hypothetical protein